MTTDEAFRIGLRRLRAICPDACATMLGRRVEVAALDRFEAMCAGKEDDPRFAIEAPRVAFLVLGEYFTAMLTRKP